MTFWFRIIMFYAATRIQISLIPIFCMLNKKLHLKTNKISCLVTNLLLTKYHGWLTCNKIPWMVNIFEYVEHKSIASFYLLVYFQISFNSKFCSLKTKHNFWLIFSKSASILKYPLHVNVWNDTDNWAIRSLQWLKFENCV